MGSLHAEVIDFRELWHGLWQLWDLEPEYLLFKAFFAFCIESSVQCTQLVQDAAKCPDISLLIIGLVLQDFRRAVRKRADAAVCEIVTFGKMLADLFKRV